MQRVVDDVDLLLPQVPLDLGDLTRCGNTGEVFRLGSSLQVAASWGCLAEGTVIVQTAAMVGSTTEVEFSIAGEVTRTSFEHTLDCMAFELTACTEADTTEEDKIIAAAGSLPKLVTNKVPIVEVAAEVASASTEEAIRGELLHFTLKSMN